MGANQGFMMLTKGRIRKLTLSEVDKGYIFITMDISVAKLLSKEFHVKIDNLEFHDKKLDGSGRIYVGKKITRQLKTKNLAIKLVGNTITIKGE